MFLFYKKTIECGCIVIALTECKDNDIFILDGHNYASICNDCTLNISEEILYERLENMSKNDNKITDNEYNGWNNDNSLFSKMQRCHEPTDDSMIIPLVEKVHTKEDDIIIDLPK